MLDYITYTCTACGHEFAENVQPSRCPVCTAHGGSRDFPTKSATIIAKQNDAFRMALLTGHFAGLNGQAVTTAGIAANGQDFVNACILALADYDDFTDFTDPFADHSFGVMDVNGERVWWKIDLYDENRRFGSSAPDNPARTYRVLTLLFPSEY